MILGKILSGAIDAQEALALSGGDSAQLVRHAIGEGCAGLLLEKVEEEGGAGLGPAQEALRRAASRDGVRAEQVLGGSERILAGLSAAGVEALVLKGVALHASVYGQPELRPVGDLDLLVRPGDAERAVAVLPALGCKQGKGLIRGDFFPGYYYETEFLAPSPLQLRIDLHVHPLRPPRYARLMPVEALWEDRRRVVLGRTPLGIPSPERMLIHLAAHAAFHGCSRLIWLYDLRAQAASFAESLDWSELVRLARAWGLVAALVAAFDEAERCLGLILPDGVRGELRGERVSWADRLVLRSAPGEAGSPLRTVLVHLLTTPGLRWKWGYALAHLLPSTAHLGQGYAGRHRGWTVAAHAQRVLRHVRSLIGFAGGAGVWRRSTVSVPVRKSGQGDRSFGQSSRRSSR